MIKPKREVTYTYKKQSDGKFKIKRVTRMPDGSFKAATIKKSLTSQDAKDEVFILNKKRKKQ